MPSTNFEDLILRDTYANRPAAGIPGRLFFDTTNSKLQRDTGSTWEDCEATGGHDAVTVSDSSTVDFTLSGQALSAAVLPGGIKLDDLGTPDDNTDLNATTGHHGLLPKLGGGTTNFLRADGTWAAASGGGTTMDYICIVDQKTQNTPGGTFSNGAWRTRDLNTELSDTGGHASVGSNQITLAAGTYIVHISAPAYVVYKHKAILYNVTDGAIALVGTSESCYTSAVIQTRSFICGQITISEPKVFEVRHQCASSSDTAGFGEATNFAAEIYTVAEFWKVA
jgi:hypothetical protein